MNLIELQDNLKNLSDQQLAQEMQMPSGNAPQYLILSELQRRQDMRSRYQAAQAKAPSTTVAEDALASAGVPQGGVAQMARSMAPQTSVTQNTGIGALAQQPMPSEEPQMQSAGGMVRSYSGGGIVRHFADGRSIIPIRPEVLTDPALIAMASRMGQSVAEYLNSMPNREQAAALAQDAISRSAESRMGNREGGNAASAVQWMPEDYVAPVEEAGPFSPVPVGRTDPNLPDFTPVNPTYEENPNPVFPNEPTAPESGPLFEPPAPLYPDMPAGNPIPGERPTGGYYDQPELPPRMTMTDRIRAGWDYPLTGEGVRASIPQRERDYEQYKIDNPTVKDMSDNRLKAERISAAPGFGELATDIGEGALSGWATSGSYVDSKIADALASMGFTGVAEDLYNRADREAKIPDAIAENERKRMEQYGEDMARFDREINLRGAPELRNPAFRDVVADGYDGTSPAVTAPATDQAAAPVADNTAPAPVTDADGTVKTPAGNIIAPAGPAGDAASTGIGALVGGSGPGSGGAGGSGVTATTGKPSSYEQQLLDAMARADKRATQDKWLALAQAGMALMSSKEPTIMGALGEAGITGLTGYKSARDEGETSRLGMEKALYELRANEAAAAQRRAGAASGETSLDKVLGGLGDNYEYYTMEVETEDPATGEKKKVRVARPGMEDIVKAIEQRQAAIGREAYPLIAGQ